MALRDHKKRIWIPEPGNPPCSANERTREPSATCPPPLRRRVPPPDHDRGRQAAGRDEVAPVLRRVRRTALGRVPRTPGVEFAHRWRLSPHRFGSDLAGPLPRRGPEASSRYSPPPTGGYLRSKAQTRDLPTAPSEPPGAL